MFFQVFLALNLFSLCQPCLAPFPPSQLLLIIQAPACLLLPLWNFFDTPQQNWLVFCIPTALCSGLCCKYLTHQSIIIDFVCLSVWYKIALSGSLPSHVKANKHKPVSLLGSNLTWSWYPCLLSSFLSASVGFCYLSVLSMYLSQKEMLKLIDNEELV